MTKKTSSQKFFLCLIALVFFAPLFSFAATGTIDSVNKYSEIMIDSLLGGTSQINWQPTGVGVTTITDSAITGYIWSESFGWINLDPTGAGVTNDGTGILGGYAWGQNAGWINFDPTGGGVSIDSLGQFSGYAWGQNTGWIEFDCGSPTACVETDWIGTTPPDDDDDDDNPGGGGSDTDACEDGDDNDGDGLIDYPDDPGCSSEDDDNEVNNVPIVTQCSDGADNDADGLTDYPADPGCVSALDDGEYNAPALCADGSDNDGDGLEDYPNDPGCSSPTDGNEYDPPIEPPCVGDACVPPEGCVGASCFPDEEIPDETPEIDEGPGDPPSDEEPETITETIENFLDTIFDGTGIRTIIGSIAGSSFPTEIPTIVGIIAALLPLLFAASPSGVVFLPFQVWSLFFGRKKTAHPWGTVYDSITKRPLDPAYVVISKYLPPQVAVPAGGVPTAVAPSTSVQEGGEKVGESITDIDGRYGFLVPGGSYILTAGKTHYEFPSKKLDGRTKDEVYDNLYFGGPITVAKDGDVVVKNIPMDPLEFDWNEFRKSQMGISGHYRVFDKMLSRISAVLFVVGCAFAVLAYLLSPTVWNTVVLGLYMLMIAIRILMGPLRPYGVITEAKTKMPLSFAILRIYSSSGTEISHKVADENGRYYSLLPKGEYTVSVEKKLDDGTYQKVFTSGKIKVFKRYLNKKFAL